MKNFFILILLFFAACSGIHITGVQKADDFSISKYKTFSFYEINRSGDALAPVGPNYESNLKLLMESITKQMAAKGLTPSGDKPDLLVNIGIVVAEKVQTRETSFANPADRTAYMGGRNYSWQAGEVEVGRYREGTVTVHLVDPAQNKLLWQGSAQSVVPEKQKNVPAVIEDAMTKLFATLK
jgi:hypothetical protein